MDANDIKIRLKDQAERVCQHLLPNGRRKGRQWFVGDIKGNPGDSLVIDIEGPKAGIWGDFAGSEKAGNLLELWIQVRGIPYKKALDEVCGWLGVSLGGHNAVFHPKPAIVKPKVATREFVPLRPDGKARKYLECERKILPAILDQYRVSESKSGEWYVFPSYSEDGETLEMWKAIAIDRKESGKKNVMTSSGTVKCLFGKHAVAEHNGQLIICEGEIDALTIAQLGGYAVSVPYGAKSETADGSSPNDEWIEYEWDWLQQFQDIVLCFDADEEGQKAAMAVLKRIGRERTRIVTMPFGCKDANECLQDEMTRELGRAIEDAKSNDPEELRRASDFEEAAWSRMHPPNDTPIGAKFFISVPFRVRPGELTVWSGFNGSGKSVFLTQMAVDLASQGERSCIGSFEMPPAHTLHIAVKQASNNHTIPSRERFGDVVRWISQSIWLFERDGLKDWKEMIEVFTYARRRYDIRHFIIDSLAKCGIDSDDYNGQKRFVDSLANWAKKEGVHVHLVAHMKKLQNEQDSGGKMDIKGASEITDLAWNVVTIWRNKEKEHKNWEASNNASDVIQAKADKMPDGKLSFSKQRETGEEPWMNLFFNRYTMRFRDIPTEGRDMPYA